MGPFFLDLMLRSPVVTGVSEESAAYSFRVDFKFILTMDVTDLSKMLLTIYYILLYHIKKEVRNNIQKCACL
jgi:hypothetical protein